MVGHPIQAVSFPQLFTGVLGSVSASDFGVFLAQPSADSRLHVPLQLGEHSRAVAAFAADTGGIADAQPPATRCDASGIGSVTLSDLGY
jgi:hypothetical protein